MCGRLVTCPCLNLNVLGGWGHAEDVIHTFGQIELAWSVDVGVVLHRISHSTEGLGFRVGEGGLLRPCIVTDSSLQGCQYG